MTSVLLTYALMAGVLVAFGVLLLKVYLPRARQEGFTRGFQQGRVYERTRDLVRDGLSPRQARTRALQQVTR